MTGRTLDLDKSRGSGTAAGLLRCTALRCAALLWASLLWASLLIAAPASAAIDVERARIVSLIAEERFDEAASAVNRLVITRDDDGDLHQIAQAFVEKKRYAEAIAVYDRVLEIDPYDRRALYWTGAIQRFDGQQEAAIATFSRLIAIDPDNYDALTGRARLSIAREEWSLAEGDLLRAEAAAPGHDEVSRMLARVYSEQGRLDETRAWLGKVEQGAGYYYDVATLHQRRGETERALEYYDYALRKDPAHAPSHRALGDYYREQDQPDPALDHYRAATASDPANATAWFWLGTLHRQRGDETSAREAFRNALAVDPGNTDAMVGLARVENFWGQAEEAERLSQPVIEKSPGYIEAWSNLGRSFELRNDQHAAHDAYTGGFERDQESEEAWRGHWRNALEIRPNVGVRFKYYSTKVVEGRAIDERVRTHYHGYSIDEEGRMPLGKDLTILAEARQFTDILDNRDNGQAIFDVTGYPVLGGLEYWFRPHWRVTALGGFGVFESNTADAIDPDQLVLARTELAYFNHHQRFEAATGFNRGHVLGRSVFSDSNGESIDFALFAENRAFVRMAKRLGDNWQWRGDASLLDYTRGGNKISAGSSLRFGAQWFDLTGFATFFPLQTRFLKCAGGLETNGGGDSFCGGTQRLEFVDVARLGSRAELDAFDTLDVFGEWSYSDFSDQNTSNYQIVGIAYRAKPWFEPFSLGVAYEREEFRRESSKYNSYDYEETGPFLRLDGTIVPHLEYDLRYTHGFRVEDGFGAFGTDTFQWFFEYYFNTWLRLGTDGRFGQNEIDENRFKFSFFGRYVF